MTLPGGYKSLANWIPGTVADANHDGPLPVSSGGGAGSTSVIVTDPGGVNQQAVTAAGDAKITLDGEIISAIPATATTGGLSIYHTVSAASTNAASVKASAGQLYGWYVYNSNAAARKVALHNTGGTPTAGSGVVMSMVIPAGSAANVSFAQGIAFSNGIGITTVTGLPDNDASAVGANDLVINLLYA